MEEEPMLSAREILIGLSVIHEGDWDTMYEVVQGRKKLDYDEVRKALSTVRSNVVTVADPDYPPALLNACHKAPFVLYYYGDLSLIQDHRRLLTVVGSRDATPYAMDLTQRICQELAENDVTIVSGLARGIDTAAAEGSLVYPGHTVAVLGNGIDRTYPPQNEELRHRIQNQGLILSEYPGFTDPRPRHFPRRNRILGSLSAGTFVGEARNQSGTLITVAYALEANRDVAALPFRADEDFANNRLIANGAAMVRSASDLLLFLQDGRRPLLDGKNIFEDYK